MAIGVAEGFDQGLFGLLEDAVTTTTVPLGLLKDFLVAML
jgi:hypothetical protein